MKKIIIAAANGFLGRNLIDHLEDTYHIVALVRKLQPDRGNVHFVQWDGENPGDWGLELEKAYAVINLAGRSVDCRYTENNRREIYRSRLHTTRLIGEAIEACVEPPRVWLNAASGTIYRHSEDHPMTEKEGEYGTGFSVDVCRKWEEAFFSFQHPELRQVALRTTFVLGTNGGAFLPLLRLANFGLGGRQGSGDQMLSWIHIDDFCRAIAFLLENPALSGPVNVTAPHPDHNSEFMRMLRKATGRKHGLPLPKWLLEAGAVVIRTETELVLKSRYVVPEKLVNAGFKFRYPRLEVALPELVEEVKNSQRRRP